MTETLPRGSDEPSFAGWPSLATAISPEGVNVTMSGSTPTSTIAAGDVASSASNSATKPGAWSSWLVTAAAIRPSLTATEVIPPPLGMPARLIDPILPPATV